MAQTDMENHLGLTLETVSRVIGTLVKQDLIKLDHKQVILTR